ncbi:MAG: FtsX-like permease family protein, partial [Bacteroidota bacterium]
VILIIATIVVWQQINHVASRDTGYDSSRLVMINYEGMDLYNNQKAIDEAVRASGVSTAFTRANFGITEVYNYSDVDWEGKAPNTTVNFPMVSTGYDYTSTLGIRIKQGRDFSPDYPSDSLAVLLNEAAVSMMKLDNPINEKITIWGAERHVVGVVEDVMMLNPFEPVRPTVIQYNPGWIGNMMVRLSPNVTTQDALTTLETIFTRYNPNLPFDYRFADEEHAKKLSSIQMVGKLSSLFGMLAILISCLGLFGLATHMAERRTKELGVRKVLGASVMNLWALLSKDFLQLILVSCLLAIPIALYLMRGWLDDFSYRIDVQWWVFLIAAMLSLFIALITVSFQSLRAAFLNPVESLRDE